jgi:hypothetical protein
MAARLNVLTSRAPTTYSSCVQCVARFGYAARGIVYVMIGYLAARAAFAVGNPTDSSGALHELLRGGGRWTVLVVALGLAAYAVWLLVQAISDPEHPDGSIGRRLFFLIPMVINASLAFTAFKLWQGRWAASESNGSEQLAAELLEKPFGEALVSLVGLGVLGFAIWQVAVAIRGDITKQLNVTDRDGHRALIALGRWGIAARAVVFGILGVFFIEAARRHDPDAAGGMGDVLRSFGHGWLLGIVAVGLIAYGIFELANAAFRRIPTR